LCTVERWRFANLDLDGIRSHRESDLCRLRLSTIVNKHASLSHSPQSGANEQNLVCQFGRAHRAMNHDLQAAALDRLYSKVTWRIVPLMVVGYIAAYFDRVNAGFAKLEPHAEVSACRKLARPAFQLERRWQELNSRAAPIS
jgi:hypothetical protein